MSPVSLDEYSRLRDLSVTDLRAEIRSGSYGGHTAGLAAGRLQANLAILPAEHALDFMRFCQRNPKPCPLVGVSETGDPMFRTLGQDIDARTDVPSYCVYRDGEMSETVDEIGAFWSDDHVAFALGCSFTFEQALADANIPVWHVAANKTVPMYRSNIMTTPAGVFGGEMVVSMRAIPADRVEEAKNISGNYPLAHGMPVHIGAPEEIGITNLYAPDWGDSPEAIGDKVPMFWACGVTPQNAIMRAKLPLCVTHKPGSMLVTDVDEHAEVPVI